MFDCVLLLAGKGTRTSLNYNKIKYLVNGKPLYQYSIDVLLKIKDLKKLVLVVNLQDYEEFRKIESNKIVVTIGGEERSDSVYNGLLKCDTEIVLIHDGARPNIIQEEVEEVYREALINNASVLAVKAKNTIKVVDKGFTNQTLNRDALYEMQTPQGVNRKMMIQGLEKLKKESINIYDDVMVLEKVFNIPARIVIGRDENIKVTTAADLKIITLFLGDKND